jgi:hypothetical protein
MRDVSLVIVSRIFFRFSSSPRKLSSASGEKFAKLMHRQRGANKERSDIYQSNLIVHGDDASKQNSNLDVLYSRWGQNNKIDNLLVLWALWTNQK